MKLAGIYKDSKGYIFTPLSKTVAGFYISTEPERRVYSQEHPSKIVSVLHEVLNGSKENVSSPLFNKLTETQKRNLKEKLKRLDIKSFNELNKRPILYCSAKMNNNEIILTPSEHDKHSGKGYINKQNEDVSISFKASDIEILKAIEEAFKKCD